MLVKEDSQSLIAQQNTLKTSKINLVTWPGFVNTFFVLDLNPVPHKRVGSKIAQQYGFHGTPHGISWKLL